LVSPPDSQLELVWQDATAYAVVRPASAGALTIGAPTQVHVAGDLIPARRLTTAQLIELATADTTLALGDSARAVRAVVALARRAVQEGLVHPQLTRGGRDWYAFWGATLDESVQGELDAIVVAAPPVCGDLGELYPHLVDQIARDRLIAAGVKLDGTGQLGRSPAVDAVLAALAARDPDLRAGPTYQGLERRLSRWVDSGLENTRETRWLLGIHLDERTVGSDLELELWLHAEDDPALALPVGLLEQGADEGFAFIRDGDPRGDLEAQLEELTPLVESYGIELADGTTLDPEHVRMFLRELMPALD
jgi:hypothetical protein